MNGDDLITLDEALAFIGFYDEETHGEGASLSAQVQDNHDAFMLDGIDELLDAAVTALAPITAKTPSPKYNFSSSEPQLASPPRKKRLRRAGSSSTVAQRRKKHELETLRAESAMLEAYLSHLSRTGGQHKPLALTKDGEILSEWHRHAFVQYQQRHQSEQTNRQLKEMLDKQQKLSNKLRRVLFKRNVLAVRDGIRADFRVEDSHFTVNNSAMLTNQLEEEVDGVYRNFRRVCRPQLASMLHSTSETTYDEKCESNAMEFATTTPLDWSMRAAFNHVWAILDSSSDRSRKPNTLQSKVHLTMPLRNSAACHFHKLHFLRKYEEEDRIIIIWSDLMQMTSKNLRLRSIAHAVFTPSRTDPLHACVMQTFLKLYVEPTSGEGVPPEDIRYGQEVVLGAYGRLMRTFWQDQQNRLLEVSSRPL
ncbi:hypothetical protein JG688_00016469 [Phytophthora aleatoria]|uniref:M96 mating-specific protein family n=1 Tax=Phytophthora aleatoria TaxID=2496075 RepID=A0A8J5ICC0_9STRA|nr:hypothetical protein JG688_00016469 [Phytophthora aleatoria]